VLYLLEPFGTVKVPPVFIFWNVSYCIVGAVVALQIIEVRLLQPAKVKPPMLVTELGMVTEVRPLQLQKAAYPILVTELGIVKEVRPLQR
jgi:hypothetical protein